MRELPCNADLRKKSFAANRIVRKRTGKKLQRYGLAELQVVGTVDFAHAAASDKPNDPTPAAKNRSWWQPTDRDGTRRRGRPWRNQTLATFREGVSLSGLTPEDWFD